MPRLGSSLPPLRPTTMIQNINPARRRQVAKLSTTLPHQVSSVNVRLGRPRYSYIIARSCAVSLRPRLFLPSQSPPPYLSQSQQTHLLSPLRPEPAMAKLSPCLLLVVLASAACAAAAAGVVTEVSSSRDPKYKCVYTVYVRTGTIWKGGTDSKIGVTLLAGDGSGIRIPDLERWGGLMGAGHDYYERGNLDIFSGRGPCMSASPCAMNLTSDGTGPHHGWYCNYVEVTSTGPHLGCAQQLFTVEQWLATDAPPYRLYKTVDKCNEKRSAVAAEATAAGDDGEEAAAAAL